MTILPNGRTASYAEDSERSAKMEMQRLTEAYLARVRVLYRDLAMRAPKLATFCRLGIGRKLATYKP